MNNYKITAVFFNNGKVMAKALYNVFADTEEEAKKKLMTVLKDSSGVPAGCDLVKLEVEK